MKRYVLDRGHALEYYFEEISRIPRESGNEKAVSDYVVAFAQKRGLAVYQDALWNVIIKKPASAEGVGKAPVILAAHLDMVCVKVPESNHDFTKDPIQLYVEQNVLRARGTTLGADDGFGVAIMLAVLDDDSLSHPPLECVFTVQEETGMIGAKYLDKSRLSGKRIISLDGDEEKTTSVSCACSDLVTLTKRYSCQPVTEARIQIRVDDLYTGTYQGVTHPQCGNAIKMVARLLDALRQKGLSYQVVSWQGGTAENSNPFASQAVLAVKNPHTIPAVLEKEFRLMMMELDDARYAGNLSLSMEAAVEVSALTPQDSDALTRLVHLMPNNLLQATIQGAEVGSINNIGTILVEDGQVEIKMACRSILDSSELQLVNHCTLLAELFGFASTVENRYASWPYNPDSKLRALANQITSRDYGYTLEEGICPGGQEVAIFLEGQEDFDALLLGAGLENLHRPDECMDLSAFHRVYRLVCLLLADME